MQTINNNKNEIKKPTEHIVIESKKVMRNNFFNPEDFKPANFPNDTLNIKYQKLEPIQKQNIVKKKIENKNDITSNLEKETTRKKLKPIRKDLLNQLKQQIEEQNKKVLPDIKLSSKETNEKKERYEKQLKKLVLIKQDTDVIKDKKVKENIDNFFKLYNNLLPSIDDINFNDFANKIKELIKYEKTKQALTKLNKEKNTTEFKQFILEANEVYQEYSKKIEKQNKIVLQQLNRLTKAMDNFKTEQKAKQEKQKKEEEKKLNLKLKKTQKNRITIISNTKKTIKLNEKTKDQDNKNNEIKKTTIIIEEQRNNTALNNKNKTQQNQDKINQQYQNKINKEKITKIFNENIDSDFAKIWNEVCNKKELIPVRQQLSKLLYAFCNTLSETLLYNETDFENKIKKLFNDHKIINFFWEAITKHEKLFGIKNTAKKHQSTDLSDDKKEITNQLKETFENEIMEYVKKTYFQQTMINKSRRTNSKLPQIWKTNDLKENKTLFAKNTRIIASGKNKNIINQKDIVKHLLTKDIL